MEVTPSTFRSFQKLPPELRRMIWEASFCVKAPGIKFVSLESDAAAQNTDGTYIVSFPCCSDEHAELNPSTFYIGQLMACRESRYVVLSRYSRNNALGINFDANTNAEVGIIAETHRTYRMRLYERDVFFDSDTLPKHDLTILHVPHQQHIDVDKAIAALGLAHRSLNFPLEPIAFEYSESWSFDPRKEGFEEMKQGTGPRACFLNFWERMRFRGGRLFLTVDKTFSEPISEASDGDRQVFHGEGYEFMDAENHNILWYEIDLEHAQLVDPDTKLMSAWDFLTEVERSLPPNWGSLPKVTILIQPNSLSKVTIEWDLPKLPANLTWREYESLSQAQACSRQNRQMPTDKLEI